MEYTRLKFFLVFVFGEKKGGSLMSLCSSTILYCSVLFCSQSMNV